MTDAGVAGIDHVSLPMQDEDAMLAFYRLLGLDVTERPEIITVYAGAQMINFHRQALWQQPDFERRAPAATPPCGDICFVWEGPEASLRAMLDRAGAAVEEGPVQRNGGRRANGMSIYTRDPDGNLLEFLTYDR